MGDPLSGLAKPICYYNLLGLYSTLERDPMAGIGKAK